jgi:ABC-type phosphate/phosphonate transport system substrate-binding protein
VRAKAQRFAGLLSATLGRPATVVLARSYEHLLEGLLVGGVDLAWMPPLVHAEAVARGALLAAVCERAGAVAYRSAVLVRQSVLHRASRDAPLAAAWVDPSSASGCLVPRMRLAEHDRPGMLLAERFCGTFSAAIASVAAAEADVTACYVPLEAQAGDETLRWIERATGVPLPGVCVWAITDAIPPDGMVLGASFADHIPVRDALLQLHDLADGHGALHALTGADRLVPVRHEVAHMIEVLRAQVRSRGG